jgi:micrococcal nuclease
MNSRYLAFIGMLLSSLFILSMTACGLLSQAETEPTATAEPAAANTTTPQSDAAAANGDAAQSEQEPAASDTMTATRTISPTATPVPDEPVADYTIINGGNLRSEPDIVAETVIGQVCPGDQVASLETQGNWLYVRLITPAVDCVAARVDAGTEGWVSSSLAIPQQPPQRDTLRMPAGLTAGIVSNVVDGDTLDVTVNGVEQRVRLLGIDTPETKHPQKPVECFGQEAAAQAAELLQGQVVLLENDESQGDTDQYDRLLRFVWLPDGRLVNYLLIADGYAFEYTYDLPYTYQQQFQAAQETAREQQRGLWAPSACNGERQAEAPTATAVPPTAVPPTAVPPAPAPTARPRGGNCDPSYPDVCIPPPPPDLDCADVAPRCRFRVLPPDPHNFDGEDNDGMGCERCP